MWKTVWIMCKTLLSWALAPVLLDYVHWGAWSLFSKFYKFLSKRPEKPAAPGEKPWESRGRGCH